MRLYHDVDHSRYIIYVTKMDLDRIKLYYTVFFIFLLINKLFIISLKNNILGKKSRCSIIVFKKCISKKIVKY